MRQRRVHKILFKEDFMNEMLDKGWMPIQFKSLSCCIFKPCIQEKYNCKLIFMNRSCKLDYERLYKQIKIHTNEKDIKIVPLKDADPIINIYYIFYERAKEKELEGKYPLSGYTDYNNKFRKSLIRLIFLTVIWIVIVSTYIILIYYSSQFTYISQYFSVIMGILVGIIMIINNIISLLITKYFYCRYFKK